MRKGLMESAWLAWLIVATIIAFGAYLRVSGIRSDFPFIYSADEANFVDRAVRLLSRNSLDPRWYGHPGQFTIYLLALSYETLFVVSKIAGTIPGFQSFLDVYRYDPTEFYFIGRLLSASFAVGVLILVALIARRLGSKWPTTALAVLLVSISPLLIEFG
jgi:dolichyl-phosphate-mannose--protein O-mannosyl transferase